MFHRNLLIIVASVLLTAAFARAEERDLILVAGQSNAVGFDAYASELPADEADKSVMFWFRVGDPPPDEFDVDSGRKWGTLRIQPKGKPLSRKADVPGEPRFKLSRQYGNFAREEGGFGPEMGLTRELRQHEKRPIAVVKAAFSGTAVATDWNPTDPGPGGACYRALVSETKAAIAAAKEQGVSLKIRALVWVQGESDATAAAAGNYEKALGEMLTALRKDLAAPEMPCLLAVNNRFGNGKNPHMPKVIEAQKAVAAKTPRCVYVDTLECETLPPSHTHFTAKGTLAVGRLFATALLKLEAGAKK